VHLKAFLRVGVVPCLTLAVVVVPRAGRLLHARDHSCFTSAGPAPKLHVEEYVAYSGGLNVTSTLIVGPTEIVLIDAQYHVSDAKRVADRIGPRASGLRKLSSRTRTRITTGVRPQSSSGFPERPCT
jgi:hypothetical protein